MTIQAPTGFILLNKPAGISSFDCIRRLQRLLGQKKRIGHAGTLDPFASGLLIIAVGREATKQIHKIMELDKEYIATGKLGELTNTLDPKGEIIERCAVPELTSLQFQDAFKKLMPSYLQTPPLYSALWHQGSRLYNLARRGVLAPAELAEIIASKQRVVQIYQIELLALDLPTFKIRARVSHGTYIRSLVNDIARELGSCATTLELVRSKIGPFSTAQALELHQLPGKTAEELLIPIEQFLEQLSSNR